MISSGNDAYDALLALDERMAKSEISLTLSKSLSGPYVAVVTELSDNRLGWASCEDIASAILAAIDDLDEKLAAIAVPATEGKDTP